MTPKIISILVAILVAVLALMVVNVWPLPTAYEVWGPVGQLQRLPPSVESLPKEEKITENSGMNLALVSYVIDGDTIELSGGERVRYIGIDAAEQNEFCYEQAKWRNEELVLGKAVRLEYDEQRKDKYGRTLAYVWLGSEMINLQLVKEGYGESYNFPPNMKYAKEFDEAESEAKKAGLGCWGL